LSPHTQIELAQCPKDFDEFGRFAFVVTQAGPAFVRSSYPDCPGCGSFVSRRFSFHKVRQPDPIRIGSEPPLNFPLRQGQFPLRVEIPQQEHRIRWVLRPPTLPAPKHMNTT
jgi:hypothetical protein